MKYSIGHAFTEHDANSTFLPFVIKKCFHNVKLVEAVLYLLSIFLWVQNKICIINTEFLLSRLSVQLNLRTFASSGLIYYMAHQNQIDYAALQLLGGQLYFSFDLGKGRAVASHPAIINDGKWHTVGSHQFCTLMLLGCLFTAFLV